MKVNEIIGIDKKSGVFVNKEGREFPYETYYYYITRKAIVSGYSVERIKVNPKRADIQASVGDVVDYIGYDRFGHVTYFKVSK